ncbi:iron uptake porin [Myxosarcina sp. GI1(2024)]
MNSKYLVSGLFFFLLWTSVARAETNQELTASNSQLNSKPIEQSKLTSQNTNSTSTVVTPSILSKSEILDYQTTAESLQDNSLFTVDGSISQLTNVSQLRDVEPGDWAYEALRSLVERYGCIAGFPNRTYRGNQALTRYEFAAGLNSCLQQIERLIAASETVAREDLETIERLSQEFEAELATIAGRVDNLEGRIAFLEDNQFSTTTIFNAEVIFAIADAFGGDPPGGCIVVGSSDDIGRGTDCSNRDEPDTETVFTYTARLGLQSSFTGQDRLRIFLTTGNFSDGGFINIGSLNTYMARFGYQAGLENEVFVDILEYRFPAFDDRVVFYGAAYGFALSNVLTANAPFFDLGRGAISRFGQLNPILRIGGAMDAGLGFDWQIFDPLRLQVAYGTRDSGNPESGFFGADHSALGVQLLAQPTDDIVTGINYVNAYSSDGTLGTYTGSINAETGGLVSDSFIPPPNPEVPPFGPCCSIPLDEQPAQINAVGGSFQWNATEKINLAAWGGYTVTNFLNELPEDNEAIGASAGKEPFANSATFSLSLGLRDPFGREGDLFGFVFGMPPKLVDAGPETPGTPVPFFEQVINNEENLAVTDNNPNLNTVGTILQEVDERGLPRTDENIVQVAEDLVEAGDLPERISQEDEATSLHFEFFYRFRVNDYIWITPGFFFVTNPGHIEANDTIYVGTIRTTFRF